MENERIGSWITAGPEQKTDIVLSLTHSENMILSFLWLSSLSLNNKQKKYELHSQRIWATISPEEIVVWRNECMNISC